MYYIIYETTNTINNKKYRGMHQTTNINDGYLGSGNGIINAIKKYGKNNFTRIILEYCYSYDELIEKEKIYVNESWVKDSNNYNIKTGGQSAGILSKESKLKISNSLKEKYASGELINWNKGLKLDPITEEHKEKISKTLKNKYKNEEHHLKGIEPWNKGTNGLQIGWNKGLKLDPMSDEQKEKITKTLKNLYKNKTYFVAVIIWVFFKLS